MSDQTPLPITFIRLADLPPDRVTTITFNPPLQLTTMQAALLRGVATAARERFVAAASFAALAARLMDQCRVGGGSQP